MNLCRTYRILFAALLLIPTVAMAAGPDELRYTFLDLGLTGGEVDFVGDDLDFAATGVTGSWGVHQNVALFGRVGFSVIDTPGGFDDIDTTELSLGVNPHFALGEKVHLVFPVALEWAEVDNGLFTDDDTGYSIGVGIRALLSPAFELSGGVQHVDIFDGDDQSITGIFRWHITDLISLSGGASASDDVTALQGGVRFTF